MNKNIFPKPERQGGWAYCLPSELGADTAQIQTAVDYHNNHEALTRNYGGALVIVYKGRIIAESYQTGTEGGPQPWSAETCNDIKSSTKSVFGTAVGVFLEDFLEEVNLETPLVGTSREESLIPQIWDQPLTDDRKQKIRIKHALSMTSGHSTAEPWLAPAKRHHKTGYAGAFQMFEYCFGWWGFDGIPDQHTLLFEPGTDFNYSNYGLELMALAMRNISGEEIGPYIYDRVLKKIGQPEKIRDNRYTEMPYSDEREFNYSDEPGWGRGGSQGGNAYGADGSSSQYGFNSIVGSTFRCTARDFARLGYLWLNKGRWEDQQLVPEPWMELATKRHLRADGTSPSNYGYTFWVQDEWDNVPADTYMARGHNLNNCYVIPSLDLVVARQGNAVTSREENDTFTEILIEEIIKALPQ